METDLRLMWPYPACAAGLLLYSKGTGALGLEAETGEWLGLRIEPAPEVLAVENVSDDSCSRARIRVELELAGPVRILLLGAGRDEQPPAEIGLR